MPSTYPTTADNFDIEHAGDAGLIQPTLDTALDALNKIEADLVAARGADASVAAALNGLRELAGAAATVEALEAAVTAINNTIDELAQSVEGSNLSALAGTSRIPITDGGPEFTKQAGPIMLPGGASPAPLQQSMFWPCVIPAHLWLDDPLDNYYVYTSTNHGSTNHGIWLQTAPTPLGPFTNRGRVHYSALGLGQSEEPTLFLDRRTGHLRMLWQQADTVQYIRIADSPDGVTWTDIGAAIQFSGGTFFDNAGDGHTGYPRVSVVGDIVIAQHLVGSGYYPTGAKSYSAAFGDPGSWVTDMRPIYPQGNFASEAGRKLDTNWQEFLWRGNPWMLTNESPFDQSGGLDEGRDVYIARLSPDRRHVVSTPRLVVTADQAWETDDPTAPFMFADGGRFYLYYTCDSKLGCCVAEGG